MCVWPEPMRESGPLHPRGAEPRYRKAISMSDLHNVGNRLGHDSPPAASDAPPAAAAGLFAPVRQSVAARLPPVAPSATDGPLQPGPSKLPHTVAPSTASADNPTTSAGARAVVSGVLSACQADTALCEADAHLAVTELVSNAQRHADGMTGFSVSLSPDGSRLRVVVEDASTQPPHCPPDTDPGTVGGRGWAIVKRLAATCHVTVLPGLGKRITVTFPLPV